MARFALAFRERRAGGCDVSMLVDIAMIGWIPGVLALYLLLPARRAMLTAVFAAWLFLPMAAYTFVGLPDYTKSTATMYGLILATLLFDPRAVLRFRPSLIDVPILIWCLTPFVSSLVNGYGAYDGMSAVMYQSLTWFMPYFFGRIYLGDQRGMRELVLALVIAALVYAPFCIVEMILSPQFHRWTYGYHQHDFIQQVRGNAYRPMVYMQHGLACSMFMASGALAASWLAISGAARSLHRVPMWAIAGLLLTITILSRSMGATMLLIAGLGALMATKYAKTRLALVLLAAAPMCYMGLRATGIWDGSHLTSLASVVSAGRASSLQARLDNENALVGRALEKPVVGWAGQGGARVRDEDGKDISVTDGLWVIAVGNNGLIGLLGLTLAVLGPPLVMLRRYPASLFASPAGGPAAVCAALLIVHACDNLFNAMVNPLFFLAAGALASALLSDRRRRAPAAPARPAQRGAPPAAARPIGASA